MMAGAPIYGSGFIELTPQVSDKALSGFSSGLAGGMTKVAKAAAAVFVAGFAAAVGAGIKGVGAFAELERGMNEVFTLLPGISDEAMGDLTQDVRDFALEFAVLPDEVVPALYQALSAGVPKENVFAFMETAQKAALGGVTELETAVDGISSVVNAYGSEVIGAGEASDLMFTAVRLGKTTFEEMSGSLFNVTPTAAALGVKFEDVTAALAAMTAQGVPTSVATTQLRQLFVELSKEGSVAAEAFQELSGKTFSEFVSEGGNVAEALGIMQEAAGDNGVALQDMFGSVEAGAAALSLTSGEGFTNALEEMGDAAGATDAAYDQMDQGLSRTWDRIKVTFNDAFLEIGERLAPHVQQFSDWFAENLPTIIENVTVWFETKFLPAVKQVFDFFQTTVIPIIQNQVIPAFQRIVEGVRGVVTWFRNLSPTMKTFIVSIGAAVAAGLAVFKIISAFKSFIVIIKSAVAAFKILKLAMIANPFTAIAVAVVAVATLIFMNWDKIKEFLGKTWTWIKDTAAGVGTWLQDKFNDAVNFIKNLFFNFTPLGLIISKFDEIKDLVTGVKDWFGDRIDDIVSFFTEMPDRIGRAVSGLFDGLKDAFKNAVNWVIRKWNDFKLEIQLPSILGGGTIGINTPNIPLFHDGGLVPGPPGTEMLAILEAGERVLSAAEVAAGAGGAGMFSGPVNFYGLPSEMAAQVGREVAWRQRTAGV